MDELDERGSLDMGGALMPAGARREHHQQRPQALAATGDDVLGDLVNQRHGTLQARANDPVYRVEVGLYQRANLFQGHWQEGGVFLGRVGALERPGIVADRGGLDRKSTRLNSSHVTT